MEGDKNYQIVLGVGIFILITFLAFIFLWSSLVPLADGAKGVPEDTVQLSIMTVKGYSVWDEGVDSKRMTLQIKRGEDNLNLTGYQIVSFDGNGAHNLFVEKAGLIPNSGQLVTVSYELPPEFSKPTTIRVSPIVDGKLKTATYEMAFTLGSDLDDSIETIPEDDLDYKFVSK